MENKDVIKFIKKLCKENGNHKLLYITKYGSHLYGSAGLDSDEDFKFIFLPDKNFLLSGKKIKHITYSSGNDGSKNKKDDVDVQGWSLQYFIELLQKGETNSIDVLYSFTNKEAVIYCHSFLKKLFKNHKKLYNINKVKKFMGFADSQAKKYGIKGENMKLIKDIIEDSILNGCLISEDPAEKTDFRLSEAIDHIIKSYGDKEKCYIEYDDKGLKYLNINGSLHLESIKLSEFMERINRKYKEYGKRSEKSMISDGNDYKALSNAYRCYVQYINLVSNGFIEFPFKGKELYDLKLIKNGYMPQGIIHKVIKEKMDLANSLSSEKFESQMDKKFVNDLIISFYKFYKYYFI